MRDKLTELEPVMVEDIFFAHGHNGNAEFYEAETPGVKWVVQSHAPECPWSAFYVETPHNGLARTLSACTQMLDGSREKDPLYDLCEPWSPNPPLLLLLGIVHLIHKGWQPSQNSGKIGAPNPLIKR